MVHTRDISIPKTTSFNRVKTALALAAVELEQVVSYDESDTATLTISGPASNIMNFFELFGRSA